MQAKMCTFIQWRTPWGRSETIKTVQKQARRLGPSGPPIVDQNRVAHQAVSWASTLHLHRKPCSEQQAQVLACPTLPPTRWALRNPPLSIRIGLPIMLCGRRRHCPSTGSPAQKNRLSSWPALTLLPTVGP